MSPWSPLTVNLSTSRSETRVTRQLTLHCEQKERGSAIANKDTRIASIFGGRGRDTLHVWEIFIGSKCGTWWPERARRFGQVIATRYDVPGTGPRKVEVFLPYQCSTRRQ